MKTVIPCSTLSYLSLFQFLVLQNCRWCISTLRLDLSIWDNIYYLLWRYYFFLSWLFLNSYYFSSYVTFELQYIYLCKYSIRSSIYIFTLKKEMSKQPPWTRHYITGKILIFLPFPASLFHSTSCLMPTEHQHINLTRLIIVVLFCYQISIFVFCL